MKKDISQKKVVLISFIVDLIDVGTNLAVAIITGSATIFSELVQGIADSLGSVFLVIGQKRAQKQADSQHPLGYAREAFFWSLLSAIVMLIIGGGLSLWRGVDQLINPQPLASPYLAIIVILIAVFTNGYAVSLSFRKLIQELGSFRAIFKNYGHPLVKGAFLRDVVGTTTSLLGLLAIVSYELFQMTLFDALGAIISALLMLISSIFLIIQAKALITGQTLPITQIDQLKKIILIHRDIETINSLVAIYSGANEILIEADLDISENLTTTQIEKLLDFLESNIKKNFPNLHRVRVLLNSY
jgi:cation diffusion facilitator family transporter